MDTSGGVDELTVAHRRHAEYFAALSHELRTPLNGLLGYADLLLEGAYGDLQPKQENAIGEIRGTAKHLLQVIESLLSFSKVSRGTQTAHPAAFDLGTEAQSLVERLRPLVEAKKQSIEVEILAEDTTVETDEVLVEQVLTNLLGNAIRFTPSNGRIRLRITELDAGALRADVEDSGPGIPEEMRRRVFEPFVQLDGGSTRAHGGTGLGLALSRSFAALVQGTLGVASSEFGGARFFFMFPTRLVQSDGGFLSREQFDALMDVQRAFSQVVPGHFNVLAVEGMTEAEWRRAEPPIRSSDRVYAANGKLYVLLFGTDTLAARMMREKLKTHFFYELKRNVQVALVSEKDLP